jgi:hypothetical protein
MTTVSIVGRMLSVGRVLADQDRRMPLNDLLTIPEACRIVP